MRMKSGNLGSILKVGLTGLLERSGDRGRGEDEGNVRKKY